MRYRLTNIITWVFVSSFLYGCATHNVKVTETVAPQKTAAQLAVEKAAKLAENKRLEDIKKAYAQAADLMTRGQYTQAESQFLALSQKAPELSSVWVNLGILAEKKNDIVSAIKYYEFALKQNPKDVVALNNLGVINRNQGHFDIAANLYRRGLKVDPRNKNLNYNMAVLNEIYLNNYPKAISYYQTYVATLDKPDMKVEGWIKALKRKLAN
jgi:tetratricopeptide (TPR) repeat protein